MTTVCRTNGLELSKLGDEVLVRLARECGHRPAERELVARYRARVNLLVVRLARRQGLEAAEIEDACQDAVFGVMKAIERYDTNQVGISGGCSFRSFLSRVVSDRFRDFVKKHWRRKRRFGQLQTVTEVVGGTTEDDPSRIAQKRETHGRIRSFMHGLESPARELMDTLVSENSLRDVAQTVGVSYDKAKRMRRRLISDLATWLEMPGKRCGRKACTRRRRFEIPR